MHKSCRAFGREMRKNLPGDRGHYRAGQLRCQATHMSKVNSIASIPINSTLATVQTRSMT